MNFLAGNQESLFIFACGQESFSFPPYLNHSGIRGMAGLLDFENLSKCNTP